MVGIQVRTQGVNGAPDHFEVDLPEGARGKALKRTIEKARGESFAADTLKLIVPGVGLINDEDAVSPAQPVVCIVRPPPPTTAMPGYKYKPGDVAWWASSPTALTRQKVRVNQAWSHQQGMYHVRVCAGGHGKTVGLTRQVQHVTVECR